MVRLMVREIWYYEHMPEKVINVHGITSMWDVLVITYGTVLVNQLDTVLHDKKVKTCRLISIAVQDDSNISTKETKKTKCKQRPKN